MSGLLGHRGLLLDRSGGGADPYWANVSALLHADGTSGSTSIVDQTGKTWTPAGNAQITTAQAKFGQSLSFDGTGDWVDGPASSDFTFGTGDFTVECWGYFTRTGNRALWGIASNFTLYRANTGILYLYDGASNILNVGIQALNQWDFFQLVRTSGVLGLSRNAGTRDTAAYATNMTSSNFRIGSAANGTSNMQGYIDDIRITKGVARPNTLPTAPFPNS